MKGRDKDEGVQGDPRPIWKGEKGLVQQLGTEEGADAGEGIWI